MNEQDFKAQLQDRVAAVEQVIYAYLPKEEGLQKTVIEAMNYSVQAGGKRLRPMLMEEVYKLFGGNGKEIRPFMAALEMIHTYSLVHDDLPALDNDMYRRGQLTVHAKYGEDMAILAGDGLLNYAFQVASLSFDGQEDNKNVAKAFAVLASKPGIYGMIGGQVLDVIMSGKMLDGEQIDFINKNKTSALIECSMMIGAILGGATEEQVNAIEKVAGSVGLAFQVQDDVLDIIGDEAKLGKPVHSDADNGKCNYATVHGLEKAKEYVNKMSESANNILEELHVQDEASKKELMTLINNLIDRDV